ncbi:MAG: phosphoribosylanthranilate isomerase [Acidobacteriota bacterium]|nr:phosphoribosylanthranilate isomerase [Acidobacteriota bacterium]
MSITVKICGITRVEDAVAAVEAGAELLGLNFYSGSPRCIPLERAQEIAAAVSGRAMLVGVFVNAPVSDVLAVARAVPLKLIQLHGEEDADDLRAIARHFPVLRSLKADASLAAAQPAQFANCSGVLVDTSTAQRGGSGVAFDWTQINWTALRRSIAPAKLLLAGGLNASNVGAAIAASRPDAVDVASGVEVAKGIKGAELMREFVAAVRAAERQLL